LLEQSLLQSKVTTVSRNVTYVTLIHSLMSQEDRATAPTWYSLVATQP